MTIKSGRPARKTFVVLSLFSPVVLSGCSGAVLTPHPGNANVFVVGVGWHTQVYIRQADATGGLRSIVASDARYVGFGFAQRGFVVPKSASPLRYVAGFFRGLAPARGVIIVTWLRTTPTQAWNPTHVAALHATSQQMRRLNTFLWSDFVHKDGQPERIASGDYPGSAFYAARQHYDFWFTCNTWTDTLLRDAGLNMNPHGVVFASTTMHDARRIATQESP
ncbi:DUF2459 domain-containing protein [Acidiphilium sp.]|uniref:DUF2459 domain-containing protein n=1 Tax=Acidiphilium sp. TaxID=527 RepID=UPI003D02496B